MKRLAVRDGEYAVLTLHRPANVDRRSSLTEVLSPILELGETIPVLFPVHPRTRPALEEALGGDVRGLRLLEPLGYLDFLRLMIGARVVLTDSGGIQEETTVLGVPCVTLRENTERPVTLTAGTNRLGGVASEGIRAAIRAALEAREEGGPPSAPPLWDGRAADRIVSLVESWWRDR